MLFPTLEKAAIIEEPAYVNEEQIALSVIKYLLLKKIKFNCFSFNILSKLIINVIKLTLN